MASSRRNASLAKPISKSSLTKGKKNKTLANTVRELRMTRKYRKMVIGNRLEISN